MTERERLMKLISDMPKDQTVPEMADYLLANGVIVPPVKVGDIVFFKNAPYTVIDIRFDGEMHFCARFDCDEENDCSKCPFPLRSALSDAVGCIGEEYKDFSPSDIGKRVFLTSEESEKALAERNGKE